MLATGCVTQRGMDPSESVPTDTNVDKSSSGDQTNNDAIETGGCLVQGKKARIKADEANEPTEVPKQKDRDFHQC